jgi:hypothetical protein
MPLDEEGKAIGTTNPLSRFTPGSIFTAIMEALVQEFSVTQLNDGSFIFSMVFIE